MSKEKKLSKDDTNRLAKWRQRLQYHFWSETDEAIFQKILDMNESSEAPMRKSKVSKKLIKKHAVQMSLNSFYDADDFKQGKIAPFEYPRVENALVKFSEEAGMEVENR